MRVLVTGATGWLGSGMARQLCARGDDVRVLVRATSDRSRLATLPVEVVHGDVTDAASVVAALDGVEQVFHGAAYLELGTSDPSQMERINVGGTEIVLGAATKRSIPAVHVSSVAALGPTGPEPCHEDHWNPAEPVVAYEGTKRAAHLVARRLAAEGAPVRIGIPGGIYGFGDDSDMAKIIRAYALYPLPIGYLPEVVQSLVHVDDCADGLLRIADRGTDGREYLLCADAVTVRRWFDIIAAAAGHRAPRWYLPTRWAVGVGPTLDRVARVFGQTMLDETIAMATRDLSFSGDRARDELAWEPRSIEAGMAEMVERFRAERPRG